MNWFLDVNDVGVVGNTIGESITSSDAAVNTAPDPFTLGVFVGFGAAVLVWGLVKICKYLFIKTFYKADDGENDA